MTSQLNSIADDHPLTLSLVGDFAPWPLVVDVCEWVIHVTGSTRLVDLLRLLCPRFDEATALSAQGLPGPDDIDEEADSLGGADFLLRRLALQIAADAKGMTIELGRLDGLSQADLVFAVRLARACNGRGPRISGCASARMLRRLKQRGLSDLTLARGESDSQILQ